MRIVAGACRGRVIQAPLGNETRPTTDRVREALFSSLYSRGITFEGATVLDAFAGSGALGLEALSRGAAQVVFYEQNKKAAETLRENILSCRFSSTAAVVRERDVYTDESLQVKAPFDVVFLDPPYATDCTFIMRFLTKLSLADAIDEKTLIVYEHSLKDQAEVAMAAEKFEFDIVHSKKYGKTAVTLLKEKS